MNFVVLSGKGISVRLEILISGSRVAMALETLRFSSTFMVCSKKNSDEEKIRAKAWIVFGKLSLLFFTTVILKI